MINPAGGWLGWVFGGGGGCLGVWVLIQDRGGRETNVLMDLIVYLYLLLYLHLYINH
jgi:hypothetical protein